MSRTNIFTSLAWIATLGLASTASARGADASGHAPGTPGTPGPPAGAPLYEQVIAYLRSCGSVVPEPTAAHPVDAMYNREAVVPPQCYTRTEGTYNPCYTCHQTPIPGRENVMDDADLQTAYSFSDVGMTNHWLNLFEDRSERVAAISDEEILSYIGEDNYSELPQRLREAGFEGWVPDLDGLGAGAGAFGPDGFAKDGSHWVAFNYKPLPSTFWPTNGSTDDVMIRLPARFRTDASGTYSKDVYTANLAILEGAIKGLDSIGCPPVDEEAVGADLDGDGRLSIAHRIAMNGEYVGAAAPVYVGTHLYPEGTEFLHTVRYVGVSPDGTVGPSRRMKEVRYMRKARSYSKPVYARQYQLEAYEKEIGNLPGYHNLGHHGLDNKNGWAVQGFIEDRSGRLRVSTYEENFFCMGCHTSVGSTIDKTFSFPRKVDGAAGWGYIDLAGMPDAPTAGESTGEIATYLARVGGGSEFRNNDEMRDRWFDQNGELDLARVAAADDVYELITPSPARALELNKAYLTIVRDQDYIYGRDATVTPPANVYQHIDNATAPTLPVEKTYSWNILLDWQAVLETR